MRTSKVEAIEVWMVTFVVPPRSAVKFSTVASIGVIIDVFGAKPKAIVIGQTVSWTEEKAALARIYWTMLEVITEWSVSLYATNA